MTEGGRNTEIDKSEVPIYLNTLLSLLIPMNKKRTITVERECLRTIRNNLRKIIKKAVYKEMDELREIQRDLDLDDPHYKEVVDKKNALWYGVGKSICKCPSCGTETADMTFNPYTEKCYCTKCYDERNKFYKKGGEAHLFP